ncbi:MAG TPA: reverse transcriptase domain-containing protein [Pirellulales bacterium]|nr:reverse transcriptase domain-containing protein [Pirellulales bacterium]
MNSIWPGCTASLLDARRRVVQLLKAGYVHVVGADLKSYFDSIPHDRLMTRLASRIAGGSVLRPIESFLQADILSELAQWTPEQGAPQGAVLSPLLSNLYPHPLDHQLAEAGYEMVRCADRSITVRSMPAVRGADPLADKTIDGKAGCGKSAPSVWREGRPGQTDLPYPYVA